MSKQMFRKGKLSIREDTKNPKDKFKVLQKQYKNKDLKFLTDAEKVTLFNACVDAGILKL